jgi:hypothetical protein
MRSVFTENTAKSIFLYQDFPQIDTEKDTDFRGFFEIQIQRI